MNANNTLDERINDRSAIIGIIGLGYVGLPLVDAFHQSGFQVYGFDIDPAKIEQLKNGESYIRHFPSETIAGWNASNRFVPTANFEELKTPDIILICVPTPLTANRDPDLTYIESTAKEISKRLRNGQLVILESTTFPGTTRDVLLPILTESGLNPGDDFWVAYSPEREDPGNQQFSAKTIPKVVGGIDDTSTKLATALYESAISVVHPVESCEIAEACKILENTYRSINIAMVNELKVLFLKMNIDIWEVIDAAKTKPFGFQAFYPGPGLGGHCIPIDPFYLTWIARKFEMPTRFIELAGEINTTMPNYVVSRTIEALNTRKKPINGSKIGIFGVAYKKDVDDHRESPAFKIMELLIHLGAEVSYTDPFISRIPSPLRSFNLPDFESQDPTHDYLTSLDCGIICTDHSTFDYQAIVDGVDLIVDTRNAVANAGLASTCVFKA